MIYERDCMQCRISGEWSEMARCLLIRFMQNAIYSAMTIYHFPSSSPRLRLSVAQPRTEFFAPAKWKTAVDLRTAFSVAVSNYRL